MLESEIQAKRRFLLFNTAITSFPGIRLHGVKHVDEPIAEPPRILIHQYFILKLRLKY